MKRKGFLGIMLMLLMSFVVIGLIGCDVSNETDELTLMMWDTFQESGIRRMTDIFTEETGISVDIQLVAWDEYWTRLAAGAQGGELPDVFWMHSNEFQRYADNELLLDLTDFINDSELVNLNYFYPDIVELYNFDGRQYLS